MTTMDTSKPHSTRIMQLIFIKPFTSKKSTHIKTHSLWTDETKISSMWESSVQKCPEELVMYPLLNWSRTSSKLGKVGSNPLFLPDHLSNLVTLKCQEIETHWYSLSEVALAWERESNILFYNFFSFTIILPMFFWIKRMTVIVTALPTHWTVFRFHVPNTKWLI